MKPSNVIDTLFAQRLALRVGELNALGEQQATAISLAQLGIEGIIGPPEGRAIGNPGDIRIRLDVAQIWQKVSGERTATGWELKGSVGPQGAQGPQGPQGPAGPSGSMVDAVYNVASGGATGARVNAGILTVSTGTLSQSAPASTNLLTSLSRTRATAGPGADLVAGWHSELALWWRGNAPSRGGFDFRWRFALASFAVGFRAFYGFRADPSMIPGNVDPSSLVNMIGMALDAGDSQWSLIHAGASGPATVIPLGAGFNVATTDALSLQLECESNGTAVNWIARNLSTGAQQLGFIDSNLPASDVFLAPHEWTSTGTEAATQIFNELVDLVGVRPTP